ncbi:MAG: 30S ribosomal protein S9 [Myxococcales bacterium]|nr:30S ribosomal protein S9 [Myxococcales bacterium]
MTTAIEATGRRKLAAAHAWLTPGTGKITVNGRADDEFFRRAALSMIIRRPLQLVEVDQQVDIAVNVKGGGLAGAAGAVRHAISRALCEYNENFRPLLKKAGFLTRDPRIKERKKPGLRGARARFQFSKR